MPILNLFRKTPKGPRISVRVWINHDAKEKACIKMAQAEKTLLFIAWSKVTCEHFQEIFKQEGIPNEVVTASDVLPYRMTGRKFVFIERHYDEIKEKKFLKSLKVDSALAHLSLSDPILSIFNSDRVQEVLENMGHNEDESIEHDMVNKSIERAMREIKNGNLPEDSSRALKEWIKGIY